jgi:hypothetical protein
MIPLLAATSAINTVDNIANAMMSQSAHPAAAGQAGGKKAAASNSDSFASLLAAHGVNSSGPVGLGTKAVG